MLLFASVLSVFQLSIRLILAASTHLEATRLRGLYVWSIQGLIRGIWHPYTPYEGEKKDASHRGWDYVRHITTQAEEVWAAMELLLLSASNAKFLRNIQAMCCV